MSLTRMNSQKPGYQEKKTYAKLLVLWLLIGADLMPYGSVVMGSLRPFYLTCTTSMTHNSRQKALRGEYLKPRLSVLVWKMLSVIKARPKREKPMSMATPVRTQRRYTTTALLSPSWIPQRATQKSRLTNGSALLRPTFPIEGRIN